MTPRPSATVLEPVGGKFCQFDAGECVSVIHDDGKTCVIERAEWKGAQVALTNQLAGVTRHMLRFVP